MAVEQLHVRHFKDGRRRDFNIIEELGPSIIIQDQDTGEFWELVVPLSLARIIDRVKKERRIATAKGLRLKGECHNGIPIYMRWQVR